MRGARPREKAKAKEERTYAGRQASSRGGGRAQSARASEAAVAAQEELDEEAAMLAELSASVQHPQESPVFEQPHGKGGTAPSPRESTPWRGPAPAPARRPRRAGCAPP